MRVLLDTCVLSELQRSNANPNVRRRVAALSPEDTFISVITTGEIARGILLLPEGRRRRDLESWFVVMEDRFQRRMLPVDREIGMMWAGLTARARLEGIQIPFADGLIAATGLRHGLHVMTRNTRDFAATGVLIVDPWQD